ncbi:MAG: A/G-specific adenine glycosylase [Bacteroidia bacterium]|nr:A/G-specific adenine glycosylase [Bacteroidia bacterium]
MLQNILLNWYLKNKRNLPWRNTTNPYIIWLSEVILQQTRVPQGLPYFQVFIKKYPTVKKLAEASNDEIMKLWQGLGYYSRARNMHTTAILIHTQFKGIFPDNYTAILKLKGIGTYTAAAIASFAFNEPIAVLDGNVFRVLARLYAIDEPINSTSGKKLFTVLAQTFLNVNEPALHNQAMMELGALVCKPQKPLCNECPLVNNCLAFLQGKQQFFPVKVKNVKVRNRYFSYFYFLVHKQTCIYQRKAGDIWQNLFDLPLLEWDQQVDNEIILNELKNKNWFSPTKKQSLYLAMQTKHILTHQRIFANFYIVKLINKPQMGKEFIWINPTELKKYAIPRLLDKFLKEQKLI